MKEYVSHKRVKAAQITGIIGTAFPNRGFVVHSLHLDDRVEPMRFADNSVEQLMFARYVPRIGDYLVEYEDGYRSISPKAAFEGGYTAVEP